MPHDPVDGPFRRGVVLALVAVTAGSLGLGLALFVIQPGEEVVSAGADSFSRSAVGHRAFVALMRQSGVPVLVSRYASAERAGTSSLLLLAEPRLESRDSPRSERLRAMVSSGRSTLLVLPKWQFREGGGTPGWIAAADLLDGVAASLPMHVASVPAMLWRPHSAPECAGEAVLPRPQLLLAAPGLRALITCGDGVLLGEVTRADGGRLLVLSDPDVISNHGLSREGVPELALTVLERARGAGQAVVLDETLHGYEKVPSMWRELFAFPFVPATLQALLALSALVASGVARFGSPVRLGRAKVTGRLLLIENTAQLLRSTGHSAYSLGRYLDAAVAQVTRSGAGPAAEPAPRSSAWLSDLGRRRGVRTDFGALAARVEALRSRDDARVAEVLEAATAIHRWQREMLDGPRAGARDPGPRSRGGAAGGGGA